MRLARIHTGRDKIVRWGYNGWHDWCSSKTAGIPEGVRQDILTFRYNDLNSLEEQFKQYPDQIAAVIVMPLEVISPEEGFLEGVKNLAHKYGALFILDEMRTGFRMSLGRADVMDSLKESRFSSTFFTNTSEMAAAIKTIECIREKNVVPYIWKLGGKLMDGLREIIKVTGVEAEMIGVDIMPYIIFNYDNAKWISPTGFSGAPVFEPGGKVEKAWCTFYAEAAQGGVLLHPNHHWYVGMSHTEQDIDETLNVCETAL